MPQKNSACCEKKTPIKCGVYETVQPGLILGCHFLRIFGKLERINKFLDLAI